MPGSVALLLGAGPAAVRSADAVTAVLAAGGAEVRPLRPRTAAECASLAAAAVADGVGTLAALGGDGLVNVALRTCAGSATALGVLPAGTGNDLARSIGMPADPVAAARALVAALGTGVTADIDIGEIGRPGAAITGPGQRRYFGTVLCAGFDARVNARANAMRLPRGPRRYDLAIVAELLGLRTRTLSVSTEDGTELELPATMVAVGNTRTYGGGIPICPAAEHTDGLLDVTVVGECGRAELLRMLPTLRTGRHIAHPAVRTLRARTVTLHADGWFGYADGEPQGDLPLTVTARPAALTVVPPTATTPRM